MTRGGPTSLPAPAGTSKVHTAGTHRVRRPEHTWDLVASLLGDFGVTRVSDITGLDNLDVPVAMAIRPLARTLTVSQGKGQTLLLAMVGAAMESIELWHAENVRPPLLHAGTPAGALALPYRLADVDTVPGSLLDDASPLDWIGATGAATGRAAPVPADLARLDGPDEERWRPPGLARSSNGLASGNSYTEAVIHALCEVVERDALSRLSTSSPGVHVNPDSLPPDAGAELVARIHRAGARLGLVQVVNRFGVPTFAARLWSPDFPLSALGYGAHLSPEVAVSRAITEAAQSRLTSIAGSRDDLTDIYGLLARGDLHHPPPVEEVRADWTELTAERPPAFLDLADELQWLCAAVLAGTGGEPLVVDLTTEPAIPVVKVILPGAGSDHAMIHPDRSGTAAIRLFAGGGSRRRR